MVRLKLHRSRLVEAPIVAPRPVQPVGRTPTVVLLAQERRLPAKDWTFVDREDDETRAAWIDRTYR